MAEFITNAAARAAVDTILARVDAGTGAGRLRIYDGAVPADADVALGAQTLLSELVFGDPAFAAAVDANPGAQATANALTRDEAADAGGTATFFRVTDSDGNAVFQGAVTATGGGGELELATTTITAGQPVEVSSLTFTLPEG